MLGIIGAMDVEVKKLREMMEDPEIQTVAGMTFYQGTIKGKAVVVVRSGDRQGERRPMQPDFSGPVSCERDHKYWNCRFS